MYTNAVPLVILDPAERAAHAALPFAYRAVNESLLPSEPAARSAFLGELAALIRAGQPGSFCIAEENLRDLYLVDISGGHRISRKLYTTHPALPGRLLVVGGVGLVAPDLDARRLTLRTPQPNMTLHRLFPDLPKTAMSAAYPTAGKTIESNPNVDPIGGYSLKVASKKWRHAAMIHDGSKGIDPARFPVVENVAWGVIGSELAFYVYALPANARPVCELLHAESLDAAPAALSRHMGAARELLRALRHLHSAGYVHNQPHQGNLYLWQDERGADRIVIADLDTLQNIRDFSAVVPEGEYLSPRAFAALVNAQVAATHAAQMAWHYFTLGLLASLAPGQFARLEGIYASIIAELIRGYIILPEDGLRAVHARIRDGYRALLAAGVSDPAGGLNRLTDRELYESDVTGLLVTYALLDESFCRDFGARRLVEGLTEARLRQMASVLLSGRAVPPDDAAYKRAMNAAFHQVIQTRSAEALAEFMRGLASRKPAPALRAAGRRGSR